jgi:hypothetical protein
MPKSTQKKKLKEKQPIKPLSKIEQSHIKTIDEIKIPFKLDRWQKNVLKAEGNICICSGRQVGKSQIIAIKAAEYIANNPKKTILIISVTEDQAERMLQKIMLYLHDNYKYMIKKGADKPTKHRVRLVNGAEAITKAVGQYGIGVLGMTVDVVVPDECAYLPEAIWASITPMLLTTGGHLWLLSTPNVRQGYFFEAYTDPDMGFKTFHVNSEEVAEARPEPQRTMMLNYLAREKARMTELQYAQQYLAQFLEEMSQMFPDDLIKQTQTLKRYDGFNSTGEYYLGVDVARMGGDETTFEILEKRGDKLIHREHITNKYTLTTETIDKVITLDQLYNFKTIYIDDGGLGVAVFDQLLQEEQTRRKVVAINNASRALDRDEARKKKLLKEDLYFNLKRLMERKQIQLLDDQDIFSSLKSIVYENDKQNTRIYGSYSHIAEGLIRAAWCVRDKKLDIFIA